MAEGDSCKEEGLINGGFIGVFDWTHLLAVYTIKVSEKHSATMGVRFGGGGTDPAAADAPAEGSAVVICKTS